MNFKIAPTLRSVCYLALLFSGWISSSIANEYPETERDFRGLPKYCRAKLQEGFANPDMHQRYGRNLKGIYGDSHHYCAAMHSFQHAEGLVPTKQPKTYWLSRVIDNIEYMEAQATNKTHRFYAEMYLLKARALLLQKQTGVAFTYFEKSLSVNPKYLSTYRELINYHLGLKNRKSALEVIDRGLEQIPNSRYLTRKKKELKGK